MSWITLEDRADDRRDFVDSLELRLEADRRAKPHVGGKQFEERGISAFGGRAQVPGRCLRSGQRDPVLGHGSSLADRTAPSRRRSARSTR